MYIIRGSKTTQILKVETHSHNIFSNYHTNSNRIPFDCGVTIEQQLEKAYLEKINVLFITNHNTLDGYHQILEFKKNHSKYDNIHVYPAEEVTVENGGHVLAYGIYKEIKSGMSLQETLDEIKKQNAISCAAHPFAVSNGIREGARYCDLMESFNSNNVDHYSNIVADKFAKEHNMISIAGSDSHVASTIGRCFNRVESDNNIDSLMHSMQRGKFIIQKTDYVSESEMYEHAHYVLSSSRDSILSSLNESHKKIYPIVKWVLDSFISHPNFKFWNLLGSLALYLSKRASKKVNINGYNPKVFENRSWKTLISLSLTPY
ncbi:MAG: metal-dependent phosphoesterase [Nitrososphaeraceae archaeon]|nr:metal-dependent phosphoesterase [Nitrososphaeraceae archaeon]